MTISGSIFLCLTQFLASSDGRGFKKMTMSTSAIVSYSSKRPKSVAIVGGGLSGLGCAYYASRYGCDITVFDANSVGKGGASSIAAGMMHPLTPQCKLIWKGVEGFECTLNILKQLNPAVVQTNRSIFRPCLTEKHHEIYSTSAADLPEWLEWLSPIEFAEMSGYRNPNFKGGLQIKNSLIINCPLYLQELWSLIERTSSNGDTRRIEWVNEDIERLSDLSSQFDAVIVTCGASVKTVWEGAKPLPLPLQLVRGQSLLYDMDPSDYPNNATINNRYPQALLCGEYIVPTASGQLLCGATHEYSDSLSDLTAPSDVHTAHELLRSKISVLHPPLESRMPVSSVSGVRVNNKRSNLGKLPIIDRHGALGNTWVMTALGSRGLVHHAYVAKLLVEAVLDGDESKVPAELRPKR